MSNDLSLPRPGRLQARTWSRKRRKRCTCERDSASVMPTQNKVNRATKDRATYAMNMNATAQMVTTTQRGCETEPDLNNKFQMAVKALEKIAEPLWVHDSRAKIARDTLAKIEPYPLPTGRTK